MSEISIKSINDTIQRKTVVVDKILKKRKTKHRQQPNPSDTTTADHGIER